MRILARKLISIESTTLTMMDVVDMAKYLLLAFVGSVTESTTIIIIIRGEVFDCYYSLG